MNKNNIMILNILYSFTELSFLGRFLIVGIVSGFMPLTALSFFWFMRQKKQQDFEKNLREMGIS
jgi:hypothetical protein